LVLAATNRPDRLDPAVLRPGRFDSVIELPLPDEPARREIFEIHLRGRPLTSDISAGELAAKTPQFSGAQIASVCDHAALRAIRRALANSQRSTPKPDLEKPSPALKVLIELEDLDAALAEVSPGPANP